MKKNTYPIEIILPTNSYQGTKSFLFALGWASQFTDVVFQSEHAKEHDMIQSIERNYSGNIAVTTPKQLLYEYQ